MRVKKVGETFDNLESERVNLDLENIVIENVGMLEVALNKGQETKEYWVNVFYQADEEQKYGGKLVYQSENFKNKKKAKKKYNKVLKSLENGDYVLIKSGLDGQFMLEHGRYAYGKYVIKLFSKMLRENLESLFLSE